MTRLSFKPTVNPGAPHPALVSALAAAVDVFRRERQDCVITSICDGRHGAGGFTFHDVNMAADLRSKHLPERLKDRILEKLRGRLGDDWDVLLEARNQTNEHYHIEFDAGRDHWQHYLSELQEQLREKVDAEGEA